MKAIVSTQYGPPEVLQIKEIDKPVPGDNEVLIRVYATSVGYGDLAARNFKAITPQKFNMPLLFWFFAKVYFGFSKQKISILGSEFAGEIEAAGKEVKLFKAGDQVFGYLGQGMGAYAEYVCMPEDGVLAIKPTRMSYAEAAVTPYGAIMALDLLKKANLQPGQKILIIGASGGIGSAAVQIAKSHFGAQVTGVCGTRRVDYVKSLGADQVIDYSKEDFTQGGQTYDVIFDVLGRSSFARCKSSLNQNGRYLLASFKLKQLLQMLWTGMRGGKKVICALAPGSVDALLSVREMSEAGKIKPVIDRCFPMEEAAEAHRYVEDGLKKGSVVITVSAHNCGA